jgi:hypothetical protein
MARRTGADQSIAELERRLRHFPELKPAYDRIIRLQNRIAEKYYIPFVSEFRFDDPVTHVLPTGFSQAILEFDNASHALQEQICVVAESTRPQAFVRRFKRFLSEQIYV